MNCTPGVTSLALVIFCCQTFILAADVCKTSTNGTSTPTSASVCKQRCLPNDVRCNFSCNYDDCEQTCAAGTCALLCFNSRICSQSCTIACPQLSCQAATCIQKCEKSDCPDMECTATKKCTQTCNHMSCKSISCQALNASCIQSGHGDMICNSDTCTQSGDGDMTCNSETCTQSGLGDMTCNSDTCTQSGPGDMTCNSETCTQSGLGDMTCNSDNCTQSCTNNSCSLTCNATTCMQTCSTNDCSMTCLPGVKECTQTCTSGECPFTCDRATTNWVRICPECMRSSGISLRVTYIALIMLAFETISTLIWRTKLLMKLSFILLYLV